MPNIYNLRPTALSNIIIVPSLFKHKYDSSNTQRMYNRTKTKLKETVCYRPKLTRRSLQLSRHTAKKSICIHGPLQMLYVIQVPTAAHAGSREYTEVASSSNRPALLEVGFRLALRPAHPFRPSRPVGATPDPAFRTDQRLMRGYLAIYLDKSGLSC